MGKLHWSNMIFRRQLITATTATTATITLAVLLVYTDAAHIDDTVVPEKLDFAAYSTSASFIQAMSKSGGTEEDCRTFATTTITTIEASVKSAQETLDAADKGEECAQEGQNVVTSAQGTLTAAKKASEEKNGEAKTAIDAKNTACTAAVASDVTLDILVSKECYEYTSETSYTSAKAACGSATASSTKADQAASTAKTAVKDREQGYNNAVSEAAKLKSTCLCRVQKEQAEAWTAASGTKEKNAADWKQAYEVICALDQKTISCDVPKCPALEEPTLSNDVSSEDCTQAQTDAPTAEPTTEPTAAASTCAPDVVPACAPDCQLCSFDVKHCSGSWEQENCATTCCGKYNKNVAGIDFLT